MDGLLDLDFAAVARAASTLAVQMGLAPLRHGVPPDTPAALIENGGTDRQRELHGTLDSVAAAGPDWARSDPAVLPLGGSSAGAAAIRLRQPAKTVGAGTRFTAEAWSG